MSKRKYELPGMKRMPGEIPSNITRISECDFANLKQLSEYIRGIISGLLSPATIIIDNLMALSLENLTGKAVGAS